MKNLLGLSATLVAFNFVTLISANPTPLIVGGEQATKGEFPWMINIRQGTPDQNSHYCGASLINSEWAITSANCAGLPLSSYNLIAGDHDNKVEEGTEQRRTVTRVVSHPSYNPFTHLNDIALIKVSEAFEFNTWVTPVPLPTAGFTPTANTTAVGWGRISETGDYSNILMKVTVPYVTDEVCRTVYPGRIADSMICAGEISGGKDSCQGDSGGPLMCNDGSTSYVCGIVSWGTRCAEPGFYGVYTEVSFYADWISSIIVTV